VPLIPLALQLLTTFAPIAAPAIGKMLAGDKGEEIATQVVSAAEALTGKKGNDVVEALRADPNLVLQYQQGLMQLQVELFKAEVNAQRDVIVTEAQSDSWITKNWRPVTMLTFTALVVAKWLGFTAPGVTQEIELAILEIIKYGLSGYVVGRSAEQIARVMAPAMLGRK
jgi:hypothetical protein